MEEYIGPPSGWGYPQSAGPLQGDSKLGFPMQGRHRPMQIPPSGPAGALERPGASRSVNSMDISSYSSLHAAKEMSATEAMQRNRSDPNLHAQQPSTSMTSRLTAEDDVFAAVGGVELGRDAEVEHHLAQAALAPQQPDPTATPSRVLLIRNVAPDASDDELSNVFKAFGDVRTLYSDAKQQGLVVVGYYDLRSAVSAKTTLHGTLLNNRPLEIHFSKQKSGVQDPWSLSQLQGSIVVYNLDPETTNEHLAFMFSKFGDVKEISQSPDRLSKKVVSFYDVRHAGAALKAMNRAEQLGKLPSHITPQQAASMAYIAGSSPSLLQLAALQLQHEHSQSQGTMSSSLPSWEGAENVEGVLGVGHSSQHSGQQQAASQPSYPGQQHQQAPAQPVYAAQHPSPLHEMQLHISDSASSIASTQAAGAGLFAPHGPSGLGKGIAASMAAAAAAMSGAGVRSGPGSGPGSGRPSFGPGAMMYQPSSSGGGVDPNAQQLLMHSGLTPTDAANMLMTLGLSCDAQGNNSMLDMQGMAGSSGGGVMQPPPGWSGAGVYGASPPQGNSAAMMAALQEMQVLQAAARQQQQMAAAAAHAQAQVQAQAQAQAHLASQLAGLQAQQALSAATMGSAGHHLTAAQLIQAAQMNLGAGPGAGAYLPHSISAAAAQLLQQAGLGMPGLGGYGGAGGMLSGRSGAGGAGDMMGGGAGGRGGDGGRGGGGGRLSRRTTDPVAEAERKAQQEKLYALVPEKIYSGQDKRTTLMIKNIPNKYTQKMLLATIDEHFHGTYDFFYLPIDFKNKCNVGYAFINMTQPLHIIPLVERFNHKKWERFNSEKVCNISYARIQGRSALISHFQNSSLMHEDKRCRPILFVLEGHEATGEQEPFPAPTGNPSGSGATPATGGQPAAPTCSSAQPLSNSSSHPNLTASSSVASLNEGSSVGSATASKPTSNK